MGAMRRAPGELPTGTVTFMFTDIESSTLLLQQMGEDAWAGVLAEHDRILRESVVANGGIEVNTEGDAFFVDFPEAVDAVAAALDVQRELARSELPHQVPLRVRMGLHTGEARLGGDDYIGLPVVHAARVAASAHGGQILISSECREALGALPGAVGLRSLGRHRLKDLGTPVELHQICHPDLGDGFPPLRTLDRVAHNLPIQPSSFLGRGDDLVLGTKLLSSNRLLSVTGPGGTGKSRLAFQLAAERLDDFPDGVWVVELADYNDPATVAKGLLSAVGVREEPGRTPTQTVVDFLSKRTALIVLDNCEHVIGAAAELADTLLRGCEGLRVIASTREPLRVAGEAVLGLGALGQGGQRSLPAAGDHRNIRG